MEIKAENTEQQIIDAAREEFMEKGFSGARMQQIADKAGINKSLLHYYFRSKDLLFERIFIDAFKSFIVVLVPQLKDEMSLEVFLKIFVESYVDLIIKNPALPGFILQEVSQNPERFQKMMLQAGARPDLIAQMVDREVKQGRIYPISGGEFMINAWSLCLFPFISRHLFQHLFWKGDKKEYDQFLEQRKKSVYQFLCRAIFINPPENK